MAITTIQRIQALLVQHPLILSLRIQGLQDLPRLPLAALRVRLRRTVLQVTVHLLRQDQRLHIQHLHIQHLLTAPLRDPHLRAVLLLTALLQELHLRAKDHDAKQDVTQEAKQEVAQGAWQRRNCFNAKCFFTELECCFCSE